MGRNARAVTREHGADAHAVFDDVSGWIRGVCGVFEEGREIKNSLEKEFLHLNLVLAAPVGIEPTSKDLESLILTDELWG